MAWRDVRGWLRDAGIPLLVADADGMDVRGWSAPRGWVLVLGNEGEGVRSEVREMADTCLAIPMADAVESLNVAVAGAILLFALTPPPQLKVKP
jgi:TrmH family RNA methyltransferase